VQQRVSVDSSTETHHESQLDAIALRAAGLRL
jgi:hypothetical protein